MGEGEGLRASLEEANCRLGQTIAEMRRQLQEAKRKLGESAEKTRVLLSIMRLFLEFGDENRAAFVRFLEREFSVQVDSASFKKTLTDLIAILPHDRVETLSLTIQQLSISP
jgi:hypothetical protein